jgi:hypothetical protein
VVLEMMSSSSPTTVAQLTVMMEMIEYPEATLALKLMVAVEMTNWRVEILEVGITTSLVAVEMTSWLAAVVVEQTTFIAVLE